MGAFLSEPVTEKVSTDEEHSRLTFGVCSMQGWRFTQEDNHSCCPQLDEDTALFGVYDGHGGAEVSRYVAGLLPDYVLARECWTKGEVGKALSEAFLVLDAHLGSRKGLRILKRMAAEDDAALDQDKKDKSSAEDDGESEDGSEENVRNLFKEAKMPLQLLMAKYGQALAACQNATDDDEAGEGSPTGSKSAKASGTTSSAADEGAGDADGEEGGSSTAAKKGEDGGGSASDEAAPKENGLPDEPAEGAAKATKNGSGGRSKLRSRPVRVLMTDDDDEDDDDSSDEEYDENSSSLMEEGGDGESSGDEDDDEEDGDGDDDDDEENLEDSISTSDKFALDMLQGPGLDSGCTAVVAVVRKGGSLYVANAGDSRCILSRKGRAIDMSVDHKPEDDAESERIKEAGGEVTSEGRVNGGLNLSRALGDHAYKQGADVGARKQMISALPDVRRVQLRKDEDEFMVLACDGIWNSMTSQEVVDFVRDRLYKDAPKGDTPEDVMQRRKAAQGVKLSEICGDMFETCLAPNTLGDGTGCDNMTAILVTFREDLWEGCSKEEVVKKEVKEEVKEEAVGDEKDLKKDEGSSEKAKGDVKVKEEDEEEKEDDDEEDHGIVLLTPPPSPPPAVVEGEEESSEDEEDGDEEILDETGEEEEEEEDENEGEEEGEGKEAEEEKEEVSNGRSGKGKGCKRRTDTVTDSPSKLKKRKVEEKVKDGGDAETKEVSSAS